MSEVAVTELQKAVESQHECHATLLQTVPIREMHQGAIVWDGVVSIFRLTDNPNAKVAYAWSHQLEGDNHRFFAVLQSGIIASPVAAVRAAIMAEARREGRQKL